MTRKAVELKLHAPGARKVSLAGNFNNWNANSLLAKKDREGNWSVRVSLDSGRYEYKFVVDGAWLNDPKCPQSIPNGLGSTNSLLVVR